MKEVEVETRKEPMHSANGLELVGLSDHIEAYCYLLYFNIAITAVLSWSFLSAVPAGGAWSVRAMLFVALLSNSIFLNVLISGALAPLTFILRKRVFTLFVLPLFFGWFNFCVYADSVLYRLLQFHLNGLVFKLLMMPRAGENFQVGMKTWLSAALVLLAIYALEYVFIFTVFRLIKSRGIAGWLRKNGVSAVLIALAIIIPVGDKIIYAWADVTDHYEILRIRYIFPLYQPFTAKRFAKKYLGVEVTPHESLRVDLGSNSLNYPRSALKLKADPRKPNIVIIAIESARFDMLNKEVMPFLTEWAGDHVMAERHYSSGNQSMHAIFGMIYGLNSTYWNRVLADRQGPVMIKELKKLGYKFAVLSSTNLTFAEANKTSFVEIREAIVDQWPKGLPADVRDRENTARFKELVDQTAEPLFVFMWYDSSHQPYRFPPEHNVFPTKLKAEDLDYVKLARDGLQNQEMFNRYRNSLHFVDSQLREVLTFLEQKKMMDNTIIIITGDHGEEFGECGQWGHGGGYDRFQVSTMMAANIPGMGQKKITRLTSHVDFVPTILSFIGVTNPWSDYSQGVPLSEDSPDRNFVLFSGWDVAAIIDNNSISVFGLEAYNAFFIPMDLNCHALPDRKKAFAEQHDNLTKVLNGFREFNK
jgi:uncharacterized protein